MTDFTQSISNTVTVFGAADVILWGSLQWGTDNWSFDNDMEFQIGKNLATASVTVSEAITKGYGVNIATQTVSVSANQTNITRQDSEGFYYVFPGDTTQGEDQETNGFTQVSGTTTSWTAESEASTTWSES